jgi:phage nucleotide-binding protein
MKVQKVKDVLKGRKITLMIYGQSGIGKTSLIKTLDTEPERILYIAADPGQLALQSNSHNQRDMTAVDFVQPKTIPDMDWVKRLASHDKVGEKYDYIVVDGLSELGETVLRNEKASQKQKGTRANMIVAYGEMADYMVDWIVVMQQSQSSVIFITHIDDDPEAPIRCTPLFPGRQVKNKLMGMFDEVLCMRMAQLEDAKPPVPALQCRRQADARFAVKDRSGRLDDFEAADLGGVLSKIFGKKETQDE